MTSPRAAACPCGSTRSYATCCEPLHAGQPAASAEALMRSSYSAFVLNLTDYLLASWHRSTRPATLDPDEPPGRRWLGLEIRRTQSGNPYASVEFVARYRSRGRGIRQHENSRFVLEQGRWFYLDGEQLP